MFAGLELKSVLLEMGRRVVLLVLLYPMCVKPANLKSGTIYSAGSATVGLDEWVGLCVLNCLVMHGTLFQCAYFTRAL